ncbi:LysM peptidoglycan-binding domain-containing protein [Polaribacter sp.]|nr:LysM peptidoglycan-binding domain-containing protein [Polaribacter sp.]MDC1464839.1 LysM peptidoglycan-binding domain-containing protein [Polaribacter sp.]
MKHLKFFVFLCIITFTVSCGQQRKYIEYKVRKGETMRVIAKKLDMKTRDLLRLNPDVGRKPEVNTLIIIPSKQLKNRAVNKDEILVSNTLNPTDKELKTTLIAEKEKQKELLILELEKEFKLHKVKKGDTFYGLTRFYNVTQEDLIALNPKLIEGLKLSQVIKIMPLEASVREENFLYRDEIEKGVALKIAILLPFRAIELDTLSGEEIFENSKLANIVTDLYFGATMAIDSLREQGVEIDVDVFDTGRNSTEINKILSENNLNENDAVIGPLYSEEVQFLADKLNVPIIFPIYSPKQEAFTGNKIVKTAPNKQLFKDKLFAYMQENFIDGNIIVVGDGKVDSKNAAIKIREILQSNDSINSFHIIMAADGYIKTEKFTEVLQPNMKNTVVIATNDNVIAASAINSLISLPEETTATVYAFDQTSVFNQIDNLKLAQLGFTFVSDVYVKEDSFEANAFNLKYKAKNGTLPSSYATKGFDVAYDLLMRLASGNDLDSTFKKGISYRLENKFDYTDNTVKIPENKGLFILKYNVDLTLTRIE